MNASRSTELKGTETEHREASGSCGVSTDDLAPFDRLVERHKEEILRFALKMAPNEEDARDVFQDTFLKAFTALEGLTPDSNVRAWLYRIAANVCRDRHRERVRAARYAREGTYLRPMLPEGPEKLLLDEELRAEIRRIVDALPFRQKAVLVLRHFEGLSHREIAEILGCTEEASRTNLSRAIRKLREMLRVYLI